MYDYILGRVVEHAATRLVLDVDGLGYELVVPLGHAFAGGTEVRVWTHFVVREDAHLLYGFADRAAREVFRLLLRVRGVGPAMALGVLSGLTAPDLFRAVVDGDAARLMAVRGVGQKTAQQILLDLGDKIRELAPLFQGTSSASGRADVLIPAKQLAGDRNAADAVAALVSIGFAEKEAKRSVDHAAAKVGCDDLEVLVRTAVAGR